MCALQMQIMKWVNHQDIYFNQFMPEAPKKSLDFFGNIFLTKAFFTKYMKTNVDQNQNIQLSFKYFVNFWLTP